MSLPSTTVFEARPGAGSATNGGGFVPGSSGTDWSQQNGPQYSVSDAVANGTTTVTSATANFGADVVGNIAYIGGAWYQIVSRTNATSIVVDRTITTGTGLTLKIGGALDLCATAEPLLTAGMTLWIKVGTQTLTTKLTLTSSGDSTSGVIAWKGYDQARGDHTGNQPLITSATNNCDLIAISTSGNAAVSFRSFDNLSLTSTAGTPGNGITGNTVTSHPAFIYLSNLTINGCKNGIIGDNAVYNGLTNLTVVNCEIKNCTTDAINNTDLTTIDGCYLHANSGYGFRWPAVGFRSETLLAYPVVISNTVVYSNTLGGIYFLAGAGNASNGGPLLDLDHCAIVSNTNDGVQLAVANGKAVVFSAENCIFYGNSGYGVNITNAAAMLLLNRNNAYGSNSSGARNNLAAGTGDLALTADPFTARTANDFTLNNTAGGGAACRAAGFPGSIPGLTTAGNADVGPLQSAGSSPTIVLSQPRRQISLPPSRVFRRPVAVIASQFVPLVVQRRRYYPLPAACRPRRSGFPISPQPIVLRSAPRSIERRATARRNPAAALFAAPAPVLVSCPRKVR